MTQPASKKNKKKKKSWLGKGTGRRGHNNIRLDAQGWRARNDDAARFRISPLRELSVKKKTSRDDATTTTTDREVGAPPRAPGGYLLRVFDLRSVGMADCGGDALRYFRLLGELNRHFPEASSRSARRRRRRADRPIVVVIDRAGVCGARERACLAYRILISPRHTSKQRDRHRRVGSEPTSSEHAAEAYARVSEPRRVVHHSALSPPPFFPSVSRFRARAQDAAHQRARGVWRVSGGPSAIWRR